MLSGLKVLDFSALLPGPYATLMMADMGAEVLRVESPTRPDLVRALPPQDASGQSAAHSYLNRGKRAITLDLKQPESIEIITKLIKEYDIVVEQFRPGVMKKLGLDYASLAAINPALIYCSITGYGQTGPLKHRAGHDINYLARSGVADYSRRLGEAPIPQGIQIADIAGGSHHAVMGILAAVVQRLRSKKGQYLDISMTDCAFSMNAMFAAGYLGGEVEPTAESNMLNGGSFYDYYETSDGRFMSVGSLEPQFLKQICEALDLTSLLSLAASPKPNESKQFKDALKETFLRHDFNHWCNVFSDLDCCVEPVLSFAEAVTQPHAQERGWVTQICANEKSIPQLSNPILKTGEGKEAGRELGAHTHSVLRDLGFTDDDIQAYKTRKII